MKILKRILYTIVGIMLAGSLAILVCALNPSLTEWLAGKELDFHTAASSR